MTQEDKEKSLKSMAANIMKDIDSDIFKIASIGNEWMHKVKMIKGFPTATEIGSPPTQIGIHNESIRTTNKIGS